MKHILGGFIAGALLAGILLRLLAGGRPGGVEETPAAALPAGRSDSADPAADAEAASFRDATARLERLRAEVASVKASQSGSAAAGNRIPASRSEFARLLSGNLDDFLRNGDRRLPANEDMILRLQALMRLLAQELGLGLDEVGASPEGFAALAREVLDALEPKLDAGARAKAEEAIETARREWEDFAARRKEMTRLERAGNVEPMFERLVEGLKESLEGRAYDAIDSLESLWYDAQPTWAGGYCTYMVASAEDAASQWTESWSHTLQLTPVQKIALKPILDDYVRALTDLHLDTTVYRSKGAFELMVRTQHRMMDTLDLSPAQLQNLDAQVTIYDFAIPPKK
ncbi:MAG: hypothetical protein AAB074_03205 [Planctomycetota bacterium]